MLVSTRGKYGVQAVFDLAHRDEEAPASIKSIAERQKLPESYLEQLMAPLRKAGVVRSVRGAQGGYLLGRAAEEITVGEIIRVLEGPMEATECGCTEACVRTDCLERGLWRGLGEAVNAYLDGVTVQDLCDEADALAEAHHPMYYI